MPTMEEYANQPPEARLARAARTADDLAAAIRGRDDAAVSTRPDGKNWSAKEVICHLRDTEESFMARFDVIMAMDDPSSPQSRPAREERQYCATTSRRRCRLPQAARGDARLLSPSRATMEAGGFTPCAGAAMDDFPPLIAWHGRQPLDSSSAPSTARVERRPRAFPTEFGAIFHEASRTGAVLGENMVGSIAWTRRRPRCRACCGPRPNPRARCHGRALRHPHALAQACAANRLGRASRRAVPCSRNA